MLDKKDIIQCERSEQIHRIISEYAEHIAVHAHEYGDHGLEDNEFKRLGIFSSAIEILRGKHAATMEEKRAFIGEILDYLEKNNYITDWEYKGNQERYDYEILSSDKKIITIEAKGSLDGNNTNIFARPSNADEFYIWSLNQNPGSDPKHNAWSGIHTRLSAEIIHRKEKVDGLIIWDMLCGTIARLCPKLLQNIDNATITGNYKVPPPCMYLFPRSIPDPRNNPEPPTWDADSLSFIHMLFKAFRCSATDITKVEIKARMEGAELQRKTVYIREGVTIIESGWTTIKRSR